MAKLYFRYGAMNCGKTSSLLQVAYNYEENDKKVVIVKSKIDTKGKRNITSRMGLKRKVDILIKPKESFKKYNDIIKDSDAILVDEAQFLNKNQIDELFYISKELDITVICYGLRTDFKTDLFEGSKRLLELADELDELITICSCGKRAKFNARFVNGIFTTSGESILIDGENSKIEYKPLCGKCYIKEMKTHMSKND